MLRVFIALLYAYTMPTKLSSWTAPTPLHMLGVFCLLGSGEGPDADSNKKHVLQKSPELGH